MQKWLRAVMMCKTVPIPAEELSTCRGQRTVWKETLPLPLLCLPLEERRTPTEQPGLLFHTTKNINAVPSCHSPPVLLPERTVVPSPGYREDAFSLQKQRKNCTLKENPALFTGCFYLQIYWSVISLFFFFFCFCLECVCACAHSCTWEGA